jgi:carboxyl-terminal processing protease
MRIRPSRLPATVLVALFVTSTLATAAAAAAAHRAAPAPGAPAAPARLDIDFEAGADSNAAWPALWRRGGNARGATIRLDAPGRASAHAARLEQPDSAGFVAITRQVPDSLRADAVALRFSAWLRTENAGQAGLWARVTGAVNPIVQDDMAGRGPGGTTPWTRYEILLPIAEETHQVTVGVRLARGGTLWVDDATIECLAPRQVPPSSSAAIAYLDAAVDSICRRSVQSSTLDWGTLHRRARLHLLGARSGRQTWPALRYALGTVDAGGELVVADSVATGASAPAIALPRVDQYDAVFGYTALPPCASASAVRRSEYAGRVQSSMAVLDSMGVLHGWLVDLRELDGGDVDPALAALGPLLGEGTLGMAFRPDGRRLVWSYAGGTCTAATGPRGGRRTTASRVIQLRDPAIPVAVLIGPRTARAGEVVAYLLRSRPDVRCFGMRTAGLGLVQEWVRLPDGTQLHLATARAGDRTGKRLDGPVEPDESVTPGPPASGMRDPETEKALRWLHDRAAERLRDRQ